MKKNLSPEEIVHAASAFQILRTGYIVLPILVGIDKFLNVFVNWEKYLAPIFPQVLNIAPETFMFGVGGIEILAGLLVAFKPQIGAFVVMAWLLGIVGNLLLTGFYYDIALRDLGLAIGALALGRLSMAFAEK